MPEDLTDWRWHAACKGADTELFFDAASNDALLREWLNDTYCSRCPVAAECLAEALQTSYHFDHGYRAGMTAGQRRKLTRPVECRHCGESFLRADDPKPKPLFHCSEACAKASHKAAKQRSAERKQRREMTRRGRK